MDNEFEFVADWQLVEQLSKIIAELKRRHPEPVNIANLDVTVSQMSASIANHIEGGGHGRND